MHQILPSLKGIQHFLKHGVCLPQVLPQNSAATFDSQPFPDEIRHFSGKIHPNQRPGGLCIGTVNMGSAREKDHRFPLVHQHDPSVDLRKAPSLGAVKQKRPVSGGLLHQLPFGMLEISGKSDLNVLQKWVVTL